MEIFMKLFYQFMAIFFNLRPTSSHLHPLQVENCDSNSRLEVDEDDNGEFRPERVNSLNTALTIYLLVTHIYIYIYSMNEVYFPK